MACLPTETRDEKNSKRRGEEGAVVALVHRYISVLKLTRKYVRKLSAGNIVFSHFGRRGVRALR